ncbi:MAG TPA: hypothetical protein VFG43_06300 [Geminicoccaceae bacterium]|nr:hypothetical protein [Geminicoccaceae bacterium]
MDRAARLRRREAREQAATLEPEPEVAPVVPAGCLPTEVLAASAAEPEASLSAKTRLLRVREAQPQGP